MEPSVSHFLTPSLCCSGSLVSSSLQMLVLTYATEAVRCGLVSLGTRATVRTRKVLTPSGRAGATLGAFVDICRGER